MGNYTTKLDLSAYFNEPFEPEQRIRVNVRLFDEFLPVEGWDISLFADPIVRLKKRNRPGPGHLSQGPVGTVFGALEKFTHWKVATRLRTHETLSASDEGPDETGQEWSSLTIVKPKHGLGMVVVPTVGWVVKLVRDPKSASHRVKLVQFARFVRRDALVEALRKDLGLGYEVLVMEGAPPTKSTFLFDDPSKDRAAGALLSSQVPLPPLADEPTVVSTSLSPGRLAVALCSSYTRAWNDFKSAKAFATAFARPLTPCWALICALKSGMKEPPAEVTTAWDTMWAIEQARCQLAITNRLPASAVLLFPADLHVDAVRIPESAVDTLRSVDADAKVVAARQPRASGEIAGDSEKPCKRPFVDESEAASVRVRAAEKLWESVRAGEAAKFWAGLGRRPEDGRKALQERVRREEELALQERLRVEERGREAEAARVARKAAHQQKIDAYMSSIGGAEQLGDDTIIKRRQKLERDDKNEVRCLLVTRDDGRRYALSLPRVHFPDVVFDEVIELGADTHVAAVMSEFQSLVFKRVPEIDGRSYLWIPGVIPLCVALRCVILGVAFALRREWRLYQIRHMCGVHGYSLGDVYSLPVVTVAPRAEYWQHSRRDIQTRLFGWSELLRDLISPSELSAAWEAAVLDMTLAERWVALATSFAFPPDMMAFRIPNLAVIPIPVGSRAEKVFKEGLGQALMTYLWETSVNVPTTDKLPDAVYGGGLHTGSSAPRYSQADTFASFHIDNDWAVGAVVAGGFVCSIMMAHWAQDAACGDACPCRLAGDVDVFVAHKCRAAVPPVHTRRPIDVIPCPYGNLGRLLGSFDMTHNQGALCVLPGGSLCVVASFDAAAGWHVRHTKCVGTPYSLKRLRSASLKGFTVHQYETEPTKLSTREQEERQLAFGMSQKSIVRW